MNARAKCRAACRWALPALLAVCASQTHAQLRPPRPEQGPRVLLYEAFPVPLPADSLGQRIDIHYRIDREFFIPVRDPEGQSPFHRSGEVVVELADSTGATAARAMESLEIPEQDADRKPAGTAWEQGVFSLSVPGGRYRVLMSADDRESRRTVMDSSRFVITPPRRASGLATASVTLVSPPAAGAPHDLVLMNYGEEILFGRPSSLLLVWRGGDDADTTLTVHYAFDEEPPAPEDRSFIPAPADVTVPVERCATLAVRTDTAGYTLSASPRGGIRTAVVPLPFARLLLRSYRVTLALRSGSDRREIVRKGMTIWPDMPFSLKEIDNALDALRYITSEAQLDSLRRGDRAERRAHLEGFWRSHGGTPLTAFNEEMTEYYRRVDHATRTFGTLRQPDGFRTDRGRIYVLYGPPTETGRTLDPVAGPREVWTYARQKRKFIFLDRDRSGNYVLVSTLPL